MHPSRTKLTNSDNRELVAVIAGPNRRGSVVYAFILLWRALRAEELSDRSSSSCGQARNNEAPAFWPGMSLSTNIVISASLICANMCELAKSIATLEDAGVDLLHIDIVDGRFSPSMPLGLELVRQLRAITTMPFDVHLMALDNEFFVDELARIGVQRLCFHIESTLHVDRLLNTVKSSGMEAGIALLPTTPFSVLDYCLGNLDYILLMLINPGYASCPNERQVPYARRRIVDCREYMMAQGVNMPIQVDGRICFDTIGHLAAAGANIFVGGTKSLFDKRSSIRENAQMMRISASRL